jgi:hypothetical protein
MYSAGESEGSTPGIDEEGEEEHHGGLRLVNEGRRGVPPPIIEVQGVQNVPGWITFTP